ncbi:transporter substrate-binding domain-containing protein [Agathobacter sp.]
MKKRMLSMVMAALMCCTMLLGCGSTASDTKSDDAKKSTTESASTSGDGDLLASIKSKGKLTIGTASGYPPYEFVDVTSSDQSVTGIDIELAQAIADKLGVELEVQDMNFSSLLTSLSAGKVDMAIAGISPTDERKETYDFSDSYLFADQSIIINKSDADKYKTLDDFKGKTLAAEKSTTQEALCQEKMPDCPLTSLEKVPDCILELKNGKADGVVAESVVGEQYILTDDTLQFADATFDTKKESAIAINKGNDDLLEILNEVIKENQDNGNFDKWVEEYSEKAAKSAE